MRSRTEHRDGDFQVAELGVLDEVWRTPETTQRLLGHRLGISLGLTNHLIHKLVSKGYVRVVKANWRRRLYAITPNGMVEKVRLTLRYVGDFLEYYQKVKLILHEELRPLALHKESRIAIYGLGDFGELVYMAVRALGIEDVDVFATAPDVDADFLGMPVRRVSDLAPHGYDRVLVAELAGTEVASSALRDLGVPSEAIVTFFDASPTGRRRLAASKEARTEAE